VSHPVLPGSAVGVLGSGQLGRMFAIAARRMGYRVHTFSPDTDTPTGQVADVEIRADYSDLDRIRQFASHVSVLTFEFENVPAAAAEAAAECTLVRPAGSVLHISQNRLREKSFLAGNGFPCAPFRPVTSLRELQQALSEIGVPAILKTAGFGYDGKGQVRILHREDAESAWDKMSGQPAILEGFIDFDRELSVVAARGADGCFVHYGAVENHHRNHILDLTIAPASLDPQLQREAVKITRGILERLEVVGVLCVELFLTRDNRLLVNELAPRPHNSGHFSFDANVTSQFEQQLRAVCGLPLGDTEQMRPAAMANLLGDLWERGEPHWESALRVPDVKLHLYGKLAPRPGRKMGHLTALAPTVDEAVERVLAAREALTQPQ
jgi:5-(carboxyamino)imidazole ribonucleotide synthase